MRRALEESWIEKYRSSSSELDNSGDVLVGFNANLDVVHNADQIDYGSVEPVLKDEVETMGELKSCLNYCLTHNENHEVELGDLDIELEGDVSIGGQAGIISNFLSNIGRGVIFYTPFLSQKLADRMNEKILYPLVDEQFVLKNVRDAVNTDRTKENHIFEFKNEKSGRLILSDSIKGFGPYFRKGVEDNLDSIEENIDAAIFAGHHNIEGNSDAKIKKSASQLRKIQRPKHLEFVYKGREKSKKIAEDILTTVDSLGLDETEFIGLTSLNEAHEGDQVNLGEAFEKSKMLLREYGIARIHLHTYNFHVVVTRDSYPVKKEHIQRSMLFGELCSLQIARKGRLPEKEDIESEDFEGYEINGFKEMKDFGEFFDLEDFKETGIAEVDGYNVVVIPTLINPDPKRTVGMGDVISSAAFLNETNYRRL